MKSAKITIKDMQIIAMERNRKCLSQEYVNNFTKLLWECKEGHQWEAIPASVKQGHWCLECAGMKKSTIKEMVALARKRGGKCLSREYSNARTKLLWECKEGHQWKAMPTNVEQGNWCLECSGKKKLSLQEMQMLARERGGKCLSQEYSNVHTKLVWECGEGHQWKAIPNNIKAGQWCRTCYLLRRANQRKLKVLKRARTS